MKVEGYSSYDILSLGHSSLRSLFPPLILCVIEYHIGEGMCDNYDTVDIGSNDDDDVQWFNVHLKAD